MLRSRKSLNMRDKPTLLFGGLSPRSFLRKYWQKQPLLVRGAFPSVSPPLSPSELAGLACETGVDSRLVIRTRKAPGWKLNHGPFRYKDFAKLPHSHWTLLVQDVDKHVPNAASLLESFQFIPNWRIDDIMISYATDGGSVGPHVDTYDVFLLQLQGMRRWDINTAPHSEAETPGLELKQVKGFKAEDSWLLMPGDMLYLPPGVAHHGVAFGECMTCSIGFRAPSQAELMDDLAGQLVDSASRVDYYSDADLVPADHPGELSRTARSKVRQMLHARLQPSDEELDIWFGRYVTEPKAWLRPAVAARRCTPMRLKQRLARDKPLAWHPAVRVAWFDTRRTCHFFVNGKHHALPSKLARFARLLGDQRRFTAAELQRHIRDPLAESLIRSFIDAGQLT